MRSIGYAVRFELRWISHCLIHTQRGGGGGGKEAHDHVSSSYKTINEGYVRLTLFRNRNTYQ